VSARVLAGRELAAGIRAEVAVRAADLTARLGRAPGLVAVLVGDDPANASYAQAKGKAARQCGVDFRLVSLGEAAGTAAAVAEVRALAADPAVDAILVELPLPAGYDRLAIEDAIDPARDADGVTSTSQGHLLAGAPGPRPATALAVMALVAASGVELAGREAVVVGRSVVVGKPVAMLLLAANATVTVAHSRTRDLVAVTRRAEVLIGATGVPGLLTAEHVRPGAVVIDVGTTWVEDGAGGRLVGDVRDDEALRAVAGAVTPVPGGVGPVTTALLLRNVLDLAEARASA
jgi:methylenetetrahydrofolate dehydrogenase (NADP+)/methenyltetrahydrofolate cyclohydrolase